MINKMLPIASHNDCPGAGNAMLMVEINVAMTIYLKKINKLHKSNRV
jgi:hypothetical protein